MKIATGASLAAILLLAGCSEAPKTETAKAPRKPPEPVTGRQGFQSMFPTARAWAIDAQPIQLRSIDLSEVKAAKGKAGAWEGTFVSASQRKSRSYTYSAVEAEGNLHQGVFAGPQDGWSGPHGQMVPFDITAIRTDSDAAYEIAAAKSEDYITKFPDKPVSFVLALSARFPNQLTWRVIWGDSIATSDYSVYVDATSGKFLEKAH
jgi:hypothetical protein